MNETKLKLSVASGKTQVSGLLWHPPEAIALLVMAHGAGANMHHTHMQSLAIALYQRNIATLRYNFPFLENGRKGRDSRATTIATVRAAVTTGNQLAGTLPLLAGGHSFGGRMTSLAQAEHTLDGVQGLVFFSFPLHPPGKPGIDRAVHLAEINQPMLFISGSRDKLASQPLLDSVLVRLGKAGALHYLATADHSYTILKRQRQGTDDVYTETAGVVCHWINQLKEP